MRAIRTNVRRAAESAGVLGIRPAESAGVLGVLLSSGEPLSVRVSSE